MDLKEEFENASKKVHELKTRPTNEQLLALYSLYKQATEGDNVSKRPGLLDIKGRAKHDAWTSKKGTSSELAMKTYIDLVNRLLN